MTLRVAMSDFFAINGHSPYGGNLINLWKPQLMNGIVVFHGVRIGSVATLAAQCLRYYLRNFLFVRLRVAVSSAILNVEGNLIILWNSQLLTNVVVVSHAGGLLELSHGRFGVLIERRDVDRGKGLAE